MKKVFLTGVVTLALGLMSFTNDSTEKVVIEENSYDCFAQADADATQIGNDYGLSYYDEYLVFNQLYDKCMSLNK